MLWRRKWQPTPVLPRKFCVSRCGLVLIPDGSRGYRQVIENRSVCPALSHALSPSWVTAWRRRFLTGEAGPRAAEQGRVRGAAPPPPPSLLRRGLPPTPPLRTSSELHALSRFPEGPETKGRRAFCYQDTKSFHLIDTRHGNQCGVGGRARGGRRHQG